MGDTWLGVDDLIDRILEREGGYVDHPADRGGPTNFGITIASLAAWRAAEEGGPVVTADDVRALTPAEARQIYRSRYITAPGYPRLWAERGISAVSSAHGALIEAAIDVGVHSGAAAGVKALQSALGLSLNIDGRLGPATVAAFASISERGAIEARSRLLIARARALVEIAIGDVDARMFLATHPAAQLHNLRGWIARLARLG